MDEIAFTSAADLAEAVRRKQLSPTEIADALLARVEQVDPQLNAYVYFDPDSVRARARVLEAALMHGDSMGPLHGVPYSVKDLTAVRGIPQTFGLVPMKNHVPDASAAIVERLEGAGGLLLGKTNTPEAGYYGVTDNQLFGPTQNPWKPGFIAGGSSGGAAAAVAAGLGPLADGTDGAGSVRIPASCCGVFGLKPSLGRIPHTVFETRFLTFVGHGPITRTVEDAALMLSVTEGPDPSDPLSLPGSGGDYLAAIREGIRGWRVAWSADLGFAHVDPEIEAICRRAVEAFEELGCAVEESQPCWEHPEEAMWNGLWAPSFAGARELLDPEALEGQLDANLVQLIEEGARLTAQDIARADALRGRMWDRFTGWFVDFDLLVCPTLCVAPFENRNFAPRHLAGECLRRQVLGWVLTYPFNMLASTPAASVPCGFTDAGLPVGLQIVGHPHAEAAVLRAAANFERARPWADRRPSL
jgi:aspartyl-tRNA(Asn)/glutamyl-tRNA(Gln) amidotransferase subunit A